MDLINRAKAKAREKYNAQPKTAANIAGSKLGEAIQQAFHPVTPATLAGAQAAQGFTGEMAPVLPKPRPYVQQLPPPQHPGGIGSVFDGLSDYQSTLDFFGRR
jgi:hypothetical protein